MRLDFVGRPVRELRAQLVLGDPDARLALDARMAAGEDDLRLPEERAQELPLPAVPDAGADGADVGDGEDQEELQALQRLHRRGECRDGLAVGYVARLGGD